MRSVKGTAGYSAIVERFLAATEAVDFDKLHEPYLDLIPKTPSKVLDAGAGVGRDASFLASMGHNVIAVEPMPAFLAAARELHNSPNIQWVEDSLPKLDMLDTMSDQFDFVLVSAVWHHLDDSERLVALSRIAELVRAGGTFALTLRNGPAGGGTHVYPTDHHQTIESAINVGLESIVAVTDQPSLLPGKRNVRWSKLAFRRL